MGMSIQKQMCMRPVNGQIKQIYILSWVKKWANRRFSDF